MSRERTLGRRLRALATLAEVVSAMRSLSAQHFRAARLALQPARSYRTEIEEAWAALDEAPASPAGPPLIVLVAADLGLVGDYVGRLVREALALRAERGPGPLVCIGRRALGPLTQAGVKPFAVVPAPASVAGIPDLLLPLVDELARAQQRREFGTLWVVAARFGGAGSYSPQRLGLLPIPRGSRTASRAAPSPYGDRAALRAVLAREYLYASLFEAMLEALTSEHGKRLVVAESARGWLEERIAATQRLAASLRRERSTQEVLEIVGAARATARNA